jgi:uncharacterized protein
VRVILDTGILISALITAGTPPDRIYQAWRKKRFQLITSQWQLDEFRRASRYSKLKEFIKPAEAGSLVNGLKHEALVLEVLPRVDLSRDPGDNPLLAMAMAGHADYLVTGDRRGLLVLKKVETTRIVTAREFLKVLQRRK